MSDSTIITDYAPPERATREEILRDAKLLSETPFLTELFDAMPNIVLILNKQRQIVFANQAFVDALKIEKKQALYGLRPGEALNCIHAGEDLIRCGTTSFCKECGGVNAMLDGLQGNKQVEDCRIIQKPNNALDLRVAATPFKTGGRRFVIFAVTDISHEKRRQVLERTFFHDISNILMPLSGYSQLIPTAVSDKKDKMMKQLFHGIQTLVEIVNTQKELIDAERGELSVRPVPVRSLEILREFVPIHNKLSSSRTNQVQIDNTAIDIEFITDKTLLSRVIDNILKNAVEASSQGEKVVVGCGQTENKYISFWVLNSQFMPPNIQSQIFNRSFSTKGEGRGIGTYSMKLLTERYLKGKVSFSSFPDKGTIFKVDLPLTLK